MSHKSTEYKKCGPYNFGLRRQIRVLEMEASSIFEGDRKRCQQYIRFDRCFDTMFLGSVDELERKFRDFETGSVYYRFE